MISSSRLRAEYTDPLGYTHREYQDANGNIYTEYRDDRGKLHTYNHTYDPTISNRLQSKRESEAQSQGILIGILVVVFGSFLAGLIYFLTRPETPEPLSVINVESSEPEVEDTIPEEPTVDSTVVDVDSPSQPSQPSQPDINITNTTPPSQTQPSNTTIVVPPSPAPANGTVASPQNSASDPQSAGSGNTAANSGQRPISDSQLQRQIAQDLADAWPNNDLGVEVSNGVVTISGTAARRDQLTEIEEMLENMPGVQGMLIEATVSNS